MSIGESWEMCQACKLHYPPSRRRKECPHAATIGESSYLSALREQGPPYKIKDRPREDRQKKDLYSEGVSDEFVEGYQR